MDRREVSGPIHPDNAASLRVAQRLGERPAGSAEVLGTTVLVYRLVRDERKTTNEPAPPDGPGDGFPSFGIASGEVPNVVVRPQRR
jgi:hypothetical protein